MEKGTAVIPGNVCRRGIWAAPVVSPAPFQTHVDEIGDVVCQHGTAMDVHCCDCHSGFIFDPDHECEREQMLCRALGNCYMMAKREIARILNGKAQSDTTSLERWRHVQRFCEETGQKSSILRASLPTEITDGAAPVVPPAPQLELREALKAARSIAVEVSRNVCAWVGPLDSPLPNGDPDSYLERMWRLRHYVGQLDKLVEQYIDPALAASVATEAPQRQPCPYNAAHECNTFGRDGVDLCTWCGQPADDWLNRKAAIEEGHDVTAGSESEFKPAAPEAQSPVKDEE